MRGPNETNIANINQNDEYWQCPHWTQEPKLETSDYSDNDQLRMVCTKTKSGYFTRYCGIYVLFDCLTFDLVTPVMAIAMCDLVLCRVAWTLSTAPLCYAARSAVSHRPAQLLSTGWGEKWMGYGRMKFIGQILHRTFSLDIPGGIQAHSRHI